MATTATIRKTKLEYLKMLKQPYQKLAIDNVKRLRGEDYLTSNDESLESVICGGFVWQETPQGHKFWSSLVNNLNSNVYKKMFKNL